MSSLENINIKIEELEQPQSIIDDPDNIDEILSDMFSMPKKKKKKDKDKIELDPNINQDDIDLIDEFNLKLKKKKKKDKTKEIEEKKLPEDYDPPTYTYQFLLNKLYDHFEDKGKPEIKQKNTIKMPTIQRMSSKKTGWINFKDCCSNLNRDLAHLQSFVVSELSTECNIDGNGFLILKGIYNQKNIEIVLRKYVVSYVQCSICKSLETSVRKDSVTRLNFLDCNSCKSNRALQQINTGFKSVGKSVKFKE